LSETTASNFTALSNNMSSNFADVNRSIDRLSKVQGLTTESGIRIDLAMSYGASKKSIAVETPIDFGRMFSGDENVAVIYGKAIARRMVKDGLVSEFLQKVDANSKRRSTVLSDDPANHNGHHSNNKKCLWKKDDQSKAGRIAVIVRDIVVDEDKLIETLTSSSGVALAVLSVHFAESLSRIKPKCLIWESLQIDAWWPPSLKINELRDIDVVVDHLHSSPSLPISKVRSQSSSSTPFSKVRTFQIAEIKTSITAAILKSATQQLLVRLLFLRYAAMAIWPRDSVLQFEGTIIARRGMTEDKPMNTLLSQTLLEMRESGMITAEEENQIRPLVV